MADKIVRQLTPEEEELAAKREDRELALASLKAELAGFEGLYLRRVTDRMTCGSRQGL
jgi:hypothetical protein